MAKAKYLEVASELKKRIEKGLDNFYNCYEELRKNKKQFIIRRK